MGSLVCLGLVAIEFGVLHLCPSHLFVACRLHQSVHSQTMGRPSWATEFMYPTWIHGRSKRYENDQERTRQMPTAKNCGSYVVWVVAGFYSDC
jgi:hypothetical protein